MTPFELVVTGLFAWYVSYVLIRTSGPFKMFVRLRSVTTIGGLLECMYCLVVWIAALGYFILGKPAIPEMIVYVVAAAGFGMILHRWTGGDHV